MFRYINISVFALVIAGVASAGGIDPTVAGYTTTDGSLYTGVACGGTYCTSVNMFSSGLSIVDNANPFSAGNISNYTPAATGAAASSTAGALTAGTGFPGACPYNNMFGGSTSYCEGVAADDFLYAGPGSAGATYSLSFTLNSAATIYGFQIYLQDDSNGTGNSVHDNDHGIANLKFYNDSVSTSSPVTNDTIVPTGGSSYNDVYGGDVTGGNKIELTDQFFASITGTTFTFTFTSPSTGSVDPPRIWEIDALTTPAVPEPGTWMLAGLGMLGLFAATKMRSRRLQSKL